MKPGEYVGTMMQVGAMASLACELPLEDAKAALERADTFGSMLDPTLYRQAMADGTIEMQRALLDALLTVKRVALRCRAQEEARRKAVPDPIIQRGGEAS